MSGFFAHGTTFSFDDVLVGGLTGIGLPDQEKERVETTSHDSEGDREYVPGLRDGGTVSLTARMLPGDPGQDKLWDNFNANDEVEACVITLPVTPAVTFSFDGFVESTGGDLPFDGPGEVTFTVRIDGPVLKNGATS